MAHQEVLDLGRIGVEAPDDEHVLRPADDTQVAVLVENSDVTSTQPTIRREDLRRGLRIVEIVRHDAAPSDQDFTRLAHRDVALGVIGDAQLEGRPGPADSGGDGLRVVARRRRGGGPRFGQAVAGDDRPKWQFGSDPEDQLDRDVRRTGDRDPQRGQVVSTPVAGSPEWTGRRWGRPATP